MEATASPSRTDVFAWVEEQEHTSSIGSQGYNEALVVLSKAGDVNGCVRIMQSMLARGIKVHRTTMNSVIAACAKAGDGAGAEAWWRRMQDVGHEPNRATYSSVIHAWVKAGNLQKAEEWLMAMTNAGFVPPKGFSRPIAYVLLGEALSSSSSSNEPDVLEVDIDRANFATRWLLRFRDLGMYLDRSTMNLLMSVYARHGDSDKAEQWVYHMNQAGIQPNQSTFNALVTASARAGNLEASWRWMRTMQELGFEPQSDQLISESLQRGRSNSTAPTISNPSQPSTRQSFQVGPEEGALASGPLQQGRGWAGEMQHAPPESTLANCGSRSTRVEGLSMTVLPRTGLGWDMANFATDAVDLRTSRNPSASYFQSQNHSMQATTTHATSAEYLSQPITTSPSRGGGKQGHSSSSSKGKGKGKGKFPHFAEQDGGHSNECQNASGRKGKQKGARQKGACFNGANFASKPPKNGKGGKSKPSGKVSVNSEGPISTNLQSSSSYAGDIKGAIGRIPVPMGLVASDVPCNFFLRQSF